VIELHRIDHVCLRVADLDEAANRWAAQFGLSERNRDAASVTLACDDEPRALVLLAARSGERPGFSRVGWELAGGCSLEDAAAHLDELGIPHRRREDRVELADPDDNELWLHAYAEPASRLPAHARRARVAPVGDRGSHQTQPGGPPVAATSSPQAPLGHPRKLGHVNFLTAHLREQLRFYTEALGMRVTDWLGDDGLWLHINSDHHVMALIDKGTGHFHHLAFDVVDIGQMRAALDHLGRHGRWLGWGPTRHGVGGNIASYVRIVEEECFVELYCDMEQLQRDHVPRHWPDDRYSSNTWGPLPPRSYFRFDHAAIEFERESLEMLGTPLPPAPAHKEPV
jgi:catechol 2,3-dioxygenase-like lactoylglutathione lyase family enzyme